MPSISARAVRQAAALGVIGTVFLSASLLAPSQALRAIGALPFRAEPVLLFAAILQFLLIPLVLWLGRVRSGRSRT